MIAQKVASGEVKRWCCVCDTRIVVKDGCLFCPRCGCDESGYEEHETNLLLALRETLGVWHGIGNTLTAMRHHIKELAQCEQCSLETVAAIQCDPDDPRNWEGD